MASQSPELLFELILGRRVSPESIEWLASGFEAYDRNGGSISLERCLKLPSRSKRDKSTRDYWLRQAAAHVQARTHHAVAEQLSKEIDAFFRCLWKQWSELSDPPPGTGPLREALFRFAKALRGNQPPCAKRIAQVLAESSGG